MHVAEDEIAMDLASYNNVVSVCTVLQGEHACVLYSVLKNTDYCRVKVSLVSSPFFHEEEPG